MQENKRTYQKWIVQIKLHQSDLIRTSEELDQQLGQGEVAIEWDTKWGSLWES